ncbi:MAG: hypothetical protein ACRCSQ_02860 [Bacteroidales bacterium]
MQYRRYSLPQTALRFRRWNRSKFAAFYSMGRHVIIGQLKNTIADASLNKQPFAYGIIHSAKELFTDSPEDTDPDEQPNQLLLEKSLYELCILPSAKFASDVNFRTHYHSILSAYRRDHSCLYALFLSPTEGI